MSGFPDILIARNTINSSEFPAAPIPYSLFKM